MRVTSSLTGKENKTRKFLKLTLLWVLVPLAVALGVSVLVAHRYVALPLEEAVQRAEVSFAGPEVEAMFNRFPSIAPRVWELYGQTESFRNALKHGNDFVPIVDKCFREGDDVLAAMNGISQYATSVHDIVPAKPPEMGWGEWVKNFARSAAEYRLPKREPLSPLDCGWTVIVATEKLGHSFLAQFYVDDYGVAVRIPSKTATFLAGQLLASGVHAAELRFVRGEAPTPGEWVMAGADVVGWFFLAKALLIHSAHVGATKLSLLAATSAKAVTTAKVGGMVLVGGSVYYVYHNPGVILSTLTDLGERFGLSPWLAQVVSVAVAIFVAILLLGLVCQFVKRVAGVFLFLPLAFWRGYRWVTSTNSPPDD